MSQFPSEIVGMYVPLDSRGGLVWIAPLDRAGRCGRPESGGAGGRRAAEQIEPVLGGAGGRRAAEQIEPGGDDRAGAERIEPVQGERTEPVRGERTGERRPGQVMAQAVEERATRNGSNAAGTKQKELPDWAALLVPHVL